MKTGRPFLIQMENSPQNAEIQNRRFTLKKEERLCSKKVIGKLFSEGESFLSFPLKIVFLKTELPEESKVQVGFSVGKRIFKRAVHRNLLRRRMREAYRLNKHILTEKTGEQQVAIFIIFIGKKILPYKTIEQATKKALIKCSEFNLTQNELNKQNHSTAG